MNKPLVSIITPSYNQALFVEATIKSVINQTYSNIEYIVIDGGSTDGSIQIIRKYSDAIRTIVYEKDNGQSDAINKGFKIATGELVGWINSDDILHPNCVSEIVNLYLKHANDGVIFYGSKLDVINEEGKTMKNIENPISGKNHLIRDNFDVTQPGSFYKREAVLEIGMIDEKLHYCMDLDLWLRLLDLGNIYSYDLHPIAAFRIWEFNKTTQGGVKFLNEIRSTLYRHGAHFWNLTILKIFWYSFKAFIKTRLNK